MHRAIDTIFQLEGESTVYSLEGDGDRSIGSEIQLLGWLGWADNNSSEANL